MFSTKHTSLLVAVFIFSGLFVLSCAHSFAAEDFPPGWLPISKLDDQPTWKEFRQIDDRIHLYLPAKDKPVRGVRLLCVP